MGLMAIANYAGAAGLGPQNAMLMYQSLHTMNKLYNQNGATATELAAQQGIAAINDVVHNNGDIVKAANKINALRRGELDSTGLVDTQVIAAFAKGLKTSNSMTMAREAAAAQYLGAYEDLAQDSLFAFRRHRNSI